VTRSIDARYDDPLDLIWRRCARSLGIEVMRSDSVYASFDGQSQLTLSTRQHFDPDDSLAQLIFHELCHALVAGPRRMKRVDWGMENIDEHDLLQEHACHRLQASLADRHGLRALFAVTTEHRSHWDTLPIDPLAMGDDPAIGLARDANDRASREPWASALDLALTQTASIAALLRASAPADSLWARTQPLHASGFPVGDDASRRCGDCGFSFVQGSGLRCRKTRALPGPVGKRVQAAARACVRFEPRLDDTSCADCGACCREAFDRVDVRARDLIKIRHPQLVSVDGYGAHLARPGGKCVALDSSLARPSERIDGPEPSYRCSVYEDRPRACADFELAGDACLTARRRVGLST